jgi:hypothetical protein
MFDFWNSAKKAKERARLNLDSLETNEKDDVGAS